jgi:hypothetical protein
MTVVVPPGFWQFIQWITEQNNGDDERRGDVGGSERRGWMPDITMSELDPSPVKRKVNAYNRRYGRAFKKCKAKHMKKNGTWKKGGFKRCVKEAHRMAKK